MICVSQFIDAQHFNPGVVIDFGSRIQRLLYLRSKVKGGNEGSGMPLQYSFVAQSRTDMRFTQTGIPDQDKVGGSCRSRGSLRRT